MSEPLLSLCMIVRDERELLPRCLASAAPYVDEVVVVDTGSTDGTPEVAKRHGAQVIERRWEDDFSLARNAALDAARGRFVLVLDADEWLDGGAAPIELRRELERVEAEALTVEIVDRLDGGAEGRYPLVRLFRNRDAYRYEGRFHEQITPSIARHAGAAELRPGSSGLVVGHDGYLAARRRERDKAGRNLAFLRRQVEAQPDDPAGRYFLARERAPLRGGRAVPGDHLEEALAHLEWLDRAPRALAAALDVDAARIHAAALLARGLARQALDVLERRGDRGVACELLRADAEAMLAADPGGLEAALSRVEACFDRATRDRGPAAEPALAGPVARARAAELLVALGRFDAARGRAEEAVGFPGGGAAPWNAMAAVARASGSVVEALRCHAHAIEADRHDPWAWLGVGTLLLELDQAREALEPLRNAERLAPGWREAGEALARAEAAEAEGAAS